jgi:hypothetical protein
MWRLWCRFYDKKLKNTQKVALFFNLNKIKSLFNQGLFEDMPENKLSMMKLIQSMKLI